MDPMRIPLRKYTRSPALAAAAVLALSGCAPVLIAAGAVVGYGVSRDSVILDMEHPPETAWKAAMEEIKSVGTIKREDPNLRRVDAQVEGIDVVVTVKSLTSSTTRVVVRARKYLLPKQLLAQRIAFGIQRRAERRGVLSL